MEKTAAALQKCKDYGYMHMGEWDVLWSITAKAMLAAEILRPGVCVRVCVCASVFDASIISFSASVCLGGCEHSCGRTNSGMST